jgi:hypothetical protein
VWSKEETENLDYLISNNNTQLAKDKRGSTSSVFFESETPATCGFNSIEFKIENEKQLTDEKKVIFMVHTFPKNIKILDHSVIISDVAYKRNCTPLKQCSEWFLNTTVRVDVDFVTDTIRFYSDNTLVVDTCDVKPSAMKTCYFMIVMDLQENNTVRILSSNICT